ncbi:glycoside hydrolase family 43 protein [Umezawaea endophytica]|uniref:Glycoside hydrolase family 43 protein n=1 Tax=Umezawaea endophytica TaxID=1654476 RepID=A0A9X3AFG4_9PSEU|nr:glycoside hydrolase family 43 protein [Umezawaea endophytica]MCS7478727.1 glycoside hydrolase family 43 protein [Umezawaea endophytica]
MTFLPGVARARSTRRGRLAAAVTVAALVLTGQPAHGAVPDTADECDLSARAYTGVRAADPSVIRVGDTYVSTQAGDGGIQVRQSSSVDGLAAAPARRVWLDAHGRGSVWAPEIVRDGGRYHIYFSAGNDSAHRMYVISSDLPDSGYTPESELALPGGRWAIDGVPVTFEGQRYFVWSGWGCTAVEQNIYITRMSDPLTPIGARYVVSRPREPWERVVGYPFINEAPEVVKDPGGRLHVVYSANGSWSEQYCLADLRLRAEGDPTHPWDWYKSTGCVFGSDPTTMMAGRDPTAAVNGPGHHTFVLPDGDIAASPPAGSTSAMMFHAVPEDLPYTWDNRHWYTGTYAWRDHTTYRRANGLGPTADTGWSLAFSE